MILPACTTSDLVDRHDRAYERGGRVVEGVDEGWVVDHPAHDTLENQSQRESREIMIREPTLSYPMRAKPRAVRMVVVNNSAGPDSMRNSEISANLSSQIVDQLPGTHSQPPSRMATMSYSATRAEESSVVDLPHCTPILNNFHGRAP